MRHSTSLYFLPESRQERGFSAAEATNGAEGKIRLVDGRAARTETPAVLQPPVAQLGLLSQPEGDGFADSVVLQGIEVLQAGAQLRLFRWLQYDRCQLLRRRNVRLLLY